MVSSAKLPRNAMGTPQAWPRVRFRLRPQAPRIREQVRPEISDIDWVKLARCVTKDIFPEKRGRAALHTVRAPSPLISYGQAKDYVLYRY